MVFVPRQQRQLLKTRKNRGLKSAMPTALAPPATLDPVNCVSYLDLTNYMANTLLRDADCMSMASGLELRLPFLDHSLVEYVLSIPGSMKLDSRTPKHLLVKAMHGLLSDEIVHHPRKGFTLPFEHWLRGPLKQSVGSALTQAGDGPPADVLDPLAVGRQDFVVKAVGIICARSLVQGEFVTR
jgi:asparagine synthase (glutamine-hydrolysing)